MPTDLSLRLKKFERRLQVTETLLASLAGVAGLLATFSVLALIDRFADTPVAVRLAIAIAGGLALAVPAAWWVRHWLLKRRDARELSKIVQNSFPGMGDRLLGAVELANGEHPDASPALLKAALRQVAKESEAYEFEQAAPHRALRRIFILAAALASILAVSIFLFPEALRQSLWRMIRPVSDIERYTFVSLADMPSEWVVPRGEPFHLAVQIESGSRWLPTTAQARIGEQSRISVPVNDGRAVFEFPGQVEPAMLRMRVGDVRRELEIVPLNRPRLTELRAKIIWPEYLRKSPSSDAVDRGRISVLSGSRFSFAGTVTRELGEAFVASRNDQRESLSIEGTDFVAATRPLVDWIEVYGDEDQASATLELSWEDVHGIMTLQPYNLAVTKAHDEPPAVSIRGVAPQLTMLVDQTVEITVAASDDYGIQDYGLRWEVISFEEGDEPEIIESSERLMGEAESSVETRMEGKLALSPSVLGVRAGERMLVRAWVRDFYPEREESISNLVEISVLSHEDHARLIRAALEEAAVRLEHALSEEERLLATHQSLHSFDDHTLQADRTSVIIEQGAEDERDNLAEVESIVDEIHENIQESLRNPLIDTDEIAPWMEVSERLSDVSSNHMAAAAQELSRAAQASSADARRAALQEAVASEQAAVDAMREAARRIDDALEFAEARSFINRLRSVARDKREVVQELREIMPEAIGLRERNLPQSIRSVATRLSHAGEKLLKDSLNIRDDLGAFYLRTDIPVYDEVRRLMSEPDVYSQFSFADERLTANLLALAGTRMLDIAQSHDDWADLLEGDQDCDECGGGEGGGGDGEQLEAEVFFGLLRARVWEEMLREQTRAADEQPDISAYEEAVKSAASRQLEIGEEFARLYDMTAHEQAQQALEYLESVSNEVADMLRLPSTGPEVIAAQTEIIEVIVALLEGDGDGQPSGSDEQDQGDASAQAAEGGAGSSQGGPSVHVDSHSGPGSGESTARGVRSAAGDPATWPAEYRDAIQRYYEAMEE